MPDVASHAKISSAHAHSHASSTAALRSGRADDRPQSPFSEMLDSAGTAADTQPQPARDSKPASKPDDTRDAKFDGKSDAKSDTTTPPKTADTDPQPTDGKPVIDTDAAATETNTTAALESALEQKPAPDAATDSKDAKTDKPADAALIAAATQIADVKPADAIAVAINAAAEPAADGKAETPDAAAAAAISGQTPKLAPKLPSLPQAAQPDTQEAPTEAIQAGAEKTETKPQFIIKADEKIVAPRATGDTPAAAPAIDAKNSDTAATAQIGAQATDAPQTAAPAGHLAANATAATNTGAAAPAANSSQTQVAVPLHAVAVEIAARASAGKQSFDIRLDPADLGKINVRLDIDKHGQVTSHVVVEKAQTLELLRRDAPQLERALQDAGLKTSGDGLQFSLQQQTSQQQDSAGTPQATAQLAIADETAIAPDVIQRGYAQLAAARGGVDIRV